MKLLHSADWHLDAPLVGFSAEETARLKAALQEVPGKVVQAAERHGCNLIVLSGDLFDGPYSQSSLLVMQRALAATALPVFIAPGNHDPMGPKSPWVQPGWSENVHIFTGGLESRSLPELNCRVYGAAFQSSDSEPLLEGFRADCSEQYAIGVFHGDPLTPQSGKNTVSRRQVADSALDYLALGHIHKGDSFREGGTLCAWPGCPMGRGFDETGEKGVLLVTLNGDAHAQFLPLDTPRFYWLKLAPQALADALPAAPTRDHYRVELIGESEPVDIAALQANYPHLPNLTLRDQTLPPIDLWANAGSDSLEGVFFDLLRSSEEDPEVVLAAARISRQLLLGREVQP